MDIQVIFHTFSQFFLKNVVVSFVSAFFTVVGGAMPISILIYLFSIQEKKRLMAYAIEMEKTLPIQQLLLDKIAELIQKSISPQTVNQSADQFKQLVESQNMFEENRKFIKYAKEYNFVSAVGNVLRMSNYMPKSMSEHKEISKSLPNS